MNAAAVVAGIEVDLTRPRELFSLDPTMAHFNHGSFGAVPIPVQRAQLRLRDEMDANPPAFFTRGLTDRIAHTRAHLAGFLGADPDNTALVANATTAINMVLGSLRLEPGDEILTTNHGYGAVTYAVERLCRRTGAVPCTAAIPLTAGDDEVIAEVTSAVRPGHTRLAIVDHVTSATAKLFPVARLAEALHALDVPVLVDGAHAPGMLDVHVTALGADFWLGNLHKWAFAPRPTAVLTVTPARRNTIEPLVVSWQQAEGFPAAVEFGGTLDYTAWLAAPAGVHLLRALGPEEVRGHNAALAAHGQRVVAEALGLDPGGLPTPAPLSVADPGPVPMRLLPLPLGSAADRIDALALRALIAERLRAEVAINVWEGRAWLRLSAQIYNRAEEYERFAEALPALLRSVA